MTSLLTDGLAFPHKKAESEELWRAIPGYEGIYEASNLGRIRTAEGKTTKSTRCSKRVWKQRIMKPKVERWANGRSDERIELWKDGEHRTWLVARLIALAWCDGYKEGYTVNHIDGNSMNNAASNLEWVTITDNIRHAFKNRLIKTGVPCTIVAQNGDRFEFESLSEASRYLGRNSGYIRLAIKQGCRIYSVSGEQFHLIKNDEAVAV